VTTPGEAGFEWQGRFYPWHVSDTGKDLMLIDRLTGMSMSEFFDAIDDKPDRGGILLALVATSLRHGNPSWSVDKIYRLATELSLSEDVEFVSTDDEEDEPRPPAPPPPIGERSRSQSNGSSLSSTTPAATTSETSSAAPT
jgi:hypothetical protein